MKHLFRGAVAGAAALLLSAGLAGTAGAAPEDCTITINDLAPAAEGNEGTDGFGAETDRFFTVTATNVIENGCDGVEVTYAFGGTATAANDDGTNDYDYFGDGGTID